MLINPCVSMPVLAAGATIGSLIKVAMGKTEKAESPDVLWSGGVEPCIVFVAYDPVTKSGWMTHGYGGRYEKWIDSFARTVEADYGDLSRLKVIAYGASQSIENHNALKDRHDVELGLLKYFDASQVELKWLTPLMVGALYLHTLTGKVETNEIPVEEEELKY